MAGSKEIRTMLEQTNTSLKELAKLRGIEYQSMRNKLYRDSFTFEEVQEIATLLGFEIHMIPKQD